MAKRIRPTIELRYNAHRKVDQELYADDFETMSPAFDSFRASHYGEETQGKDGIAEKRKFLMAMRYALGASKPIILGCSIRRGTTPEILGQRQGPTGRLGLG